MCLLSFGELKVHSAEINSCASHLKGHSSQISSTQRALTELSWTQSELEWNQPACLSPQRALKSNKLNKTCTQSTLLNSNQLSCLSPQRALKSNQLNTACTHFNITHTVFTQYNFTNGTWIHLSATHLNVHLSKIYSTCLTPAQIISTKRSLRN